MQLYNNLTFKKSPIKAGKLQKILPVFISIIVFSIIAILVSNPAKYNKSVISGFMLFANCVFPGLFPFLILTKILTELGAIKSLSRRFSKTTQKLFNVSGEASFIFLMSALCGYPMGARLTADMVKSKALTENDAIKVLSFCSVSGPIFAIGTIGVAMFKSFKVGAIIFISHLVSSLLCGLIFCRNKKQPTARRILEKTTAAPAPAFTVSPQQANTAAPTQAITAAPTQANTVSPSSSPTASPLLSTAKNAEKTSSPATAETKSIDEIISDGVYSAVSTILVVGAFITVFFMLIDMIISTKIFLPVENIINSFLSLVGVTRPLGNGIVCGIVEMTRGCSELSKFGATTATVTLCAGLLSFSGLSIIMQSLTLLSGIKIKISKYFLQKITHAIICMGLTFLICLIVL